MVLKNNSAAAFLTCSSIDRFGGANARDVPPERKLSDQHRLDAIGMLAAV
jgi:hypothetical protein